jgi:DNA invertase Pin-like site-specific DNA recombinase
VHGIEVGRLSQATNPALSLDEQQATPESRSSAKRGLSHSCTQIQCIERCSALVIAVEDYSTPASIIPRHAHVGLMLAVLGGLAEFERELILARTGDGRTRAKARGVRFGRPPALTAHQRQEVVQRLAEGATQADLARTYGVSQATISRLQPSPFEGASVGAT